jgi:hypothetical protein
MPYSQCQRVYRAWGNATNNTSTIIATPLAIDMALTYTTISVGLFSIGQQKNNRGSIFGQVTEKLS